MLQTYKWQLKLEEDKDICVYILYYIYEAPSCIILESKKIYKKNQSLTSSKQSLAFLYYFFCSHLLIEWNADA